jgi:membrane protein DedA with SNARE-associated domain
VEEIIGPIPSPVILMSSGSIVASRGLGWSYLILLAVFASAGKSLASWIIYYITDKTEDFLLSKYGRLLGISHKNVEKIGSYFNGSWKDDFLIFLFRAIPIFPTTTVSVACGFIKIDQKSFIRSTFLGFFIRSLFILYLGYQGIESFAIIKQWFTE